MSTLPFPLRRACSLVSVALLALIASTRTVEAQFAVPPPALEPTSQSAPSTSPSSGSTAADAPGSDGPTASPPAEGTAKSAESAAKSNPSESTEIGTVTVRGHRNVLGEAEERLRRLKESLPDPGDGGTIQETFGQQARQKVEKFVKNDTDPNKRSDAGKAFMQKALDPLNAHAGEGHLEQDGADYKDSYCGTGECAH